MAKGKPDYAAMSAELDAILLTMQQDTLDVDTALELYQKGLKLVASLETYLKQTENTVHTLQPVSKEE